MTAIAASAMIPAPKNRGRVRSKPTMKSQPFEDDQAKRAEGNPRPDLELAAMDGVDRDRAADRRQREAVGGLEPGDLFREEIDGEPGSVGLSHRNLLDCVETYQVRIAERRKRAPGERATAAVRSHNR